MKLTIRPGKRKRRLAAAAGVMLVGTLRLADAAVVDRVNPASALIDDRSGSGAVDIVVRLLDAERPVSMTFAGTERIFSTQVDVALGDFGVDNVHFTFTGTRLDFAGQDQRDVWADHIAGVSLGGRPAAGTDSINVDIGASENPGSYTVNFSNFGSEFATLRLLEDEFLTYDAPFTLRIDPGVLETPIPGALWLFGSAALALVTVSRRKVGHGRRT